MFFYFRVLFILFAILLTAGCQTVKFKYADSKLGQYFAQKELKHQLDQFQWPELIPEEPLPTPIVEAPAVAVIELPIPLKELHESAHVVLSDSEIRCMATNMYYEARGESDLGMIAVGYVVLNRMADTRFKPNTVCGIVKQRTASVCQFSWVCGQKNWNLNNEAYKRAERLAIAVMTREVFNPVDNSIYFRTHAASRKGYSSQRHVASIGGHRFFASR